METVSKKNQEQCAIHNVRHCALFEVQKYDNTQLRNLFKEIHKIGNADAPAKVKQSKTMKQLFELEKSNYNYWIDKYYNVSRAIEIEILHRVRQDII